VLDLELGWTRCGRRGGELLPKAGVLDVRVPLALVEAADAQEGVAADRRAVV